MTQQGAEKAARRIARRMIEIMRSRGLVFTSYRGQWDDVLKEDEIAAIITEEMERETRIEEFSCRECGGKLTPNPMEGHKNSWMHFEGRKDCKLRGKGQEYLSRTAFVAEREKERKL